MKKITLFLCFVAAFGEIVSSSNGARRRSTAPDASDREMTVHPNPIPHGRETNPVPYGRHDSNQNNNFEVPGVMSVANIEDAGVSLEESPRHDRMAAGQAGFHPTESMWRRIAAGLQLRRSPVHATAVRVEPGRYLQPRYDDSDDNRQRSHSKVSLCGLKAGTIFTAVMLTCGMGWLSYSNWLLNGTVGQLTETTTKLVGTVSTTVGQVTSQLSVVNKELGDLGDRLNSLTSIVNSVAQTVPNAVGNLQAEVLRANTLATSQIATLTQQSQALTASLGNITNSLNIVQTLMPSSLNAVQDKIESLGAQLRAVNGTLGVLQQAINPLTGITPSVLSQIQSVSSKIDSIGSQISALGNLIPGGLPAVTLPGGISLPRP